MSSKKFHPFSISLLSLSFLWIFILAGCSGSKNAVSEGSFRSPTYVKKNYQQIVVYAKVEQNAYREKLENAMVAMLEKNGYKAIPAYKHFEVTYKYDSVTFMNKINELKVDGILTMDYLGHMTGVQDSYRYNGGMYNFFMSGSTPYDLETTSRQVGYMRIDFYNLDARVSQYNSMMQVKLFNGFDPAVKLLTEDTYRRLKSDQII